MDPRLINSFKCTEIFSLFGEKSEKLIEIMEVVKLRPGEILYEKGDSSDSMYVLVAGLLEAIIRTKWGEEKTVTKIRCGQTVGEAGLITLEPRAVTIRALRSSTLLKLTKEAFDNYFIAEPKVLLKLMSFLIAKSMNTLQAIEKTVYHYVNLAFISANEQVDCNQFFSRLIPLLQRHHKIKFFNSEDYHLVDDDLINALDESESNNDYVIYKINLKNQDVADVMLERVDRIFIIGDGAKSAQIDANILTALQQNQNKKELILLYANRIKPTQTTSWLKLLDFFRYHHIALNHDNDCNRLLRFITGKALGLVLSGGGTKGWVHAGVLKALDEANIEIDFIAGTSIGAVIGAKYLLENNYDAFYEGMKEFAQINNKPYRITNFTYPVVSVLTGKKMTTATQTLFGDALIENLWKPYFCIACNISQSKEAVCREGLIWEWTRASSSIPGAIPPVTIDGRIYVDGSMINNLPVDVMKEFFDGMGKVIAIDLSYHNDKKKYKFPLIINFIDALQLKLRSAYKDYKIPTFAEILSRSMLMGSSKQMQQNELMADILIRPDLTDYRLIPEKIRNEKLFNIGYQAMQEKLENLKKLFEGYD